MAPHADDTLTDWLISKFGADSKSSAPEGPMQAFQSFKAWRSEQNKTWSDTLNKMLEDAEKDPTDRTMMLVETIMQLGDSPNGTHFDRSLSDSIVKHVYQDRNALSGLLSHWEKKVAKDASDLSWLDIRLKKLVLVAEVLKGQENAAGIGGDYPKKMAEVADRLRKMDKEEQKQGGGQMQVSVKTSAGSKTLPLVPLSKWFAAEQGIKA